jgi:hypothetical protein
LRNSLISRRLDAFIKPQSAGSGNRREAFFRTNLISTMQSRKERKNTLFS